MDGILEFIKTAWIYMWRVDQIIFLIILLGILLLFLFAFMFRIYNKFRNKRDNIDNDENP